MLSTAVKELEKKLLKLDDLSYDSIDRLMRSIMKKRNVTAKQLHYGFVDKNKCTPDDWIRKMKKKKIEESNLSSFKEIKNTTSKPPTIKKEEYNTSLVNKILGEIQEEIGCPTKKVHSVREIADKHKVDVEEIKSQLKKGLKVEQEHTNSKALARKIALQHIAERPDYYTKLQKVEEAKKIMTKDEDPCWDGYEMRGMKKKRGKKVPNCVKIDEAVKLPSDYGNVLSIILTWRGRTIMSQMFFPQIKMPSKKQVEYEIRKVYPDSRVLSYNVSQYNSSQPIIQISNSRSKNYLLNNKTIGEEVSLGKPYRTPDGPKKFAVKVKNENGNIVTVRFGDPNMEIKRDDPERLRAFRSRHNCDNPGPRTKARYWSCYQWRKGHKVED